MRVIPRWKTVKDIPGVMPCEDMREILSAVVEYYDYTPITGELNKINIDDFQLCFEFG